MLFWGPLKNTMEKARAFKMAKRNVERDENHRILDHQAFTEELCSAHSVEISFRFYVKSIFDNLEVAVFALLESPKLISRKI